MPARPRAGPRLTPAPALDSAHRLRLDPARKAHRCGGHRVLDVVAPAQAKLIGGHQTRLAPAKLAGGELQVRALSLAEGHACRRARAQRLADEPLGAVRAAVL